MTIYSKRRGRRSLAAVLAALLMASLLAVVAGSPVQAANTASEQLFDRNENGKQDSREFGGADRYETALWLAERYAVEQGGLGSVDTAIVASGVTLIDAVTSAGLSQFMQAPVLLTRPEALDARVARFIERHGIDEVIVTGGPAAMPDSIVDELEALESEPTVTRISGANRNATAVAIAEAVGVNGSWCGTDDKSAILVHGATSGAFEAIAVGPLVYGLELPLLLSESDVLPEASAGFISGEGVERVVIVGGTDRVSEGVADAVKVLGASVTRVGGGSAAETSVELAKLMVGDCRDDLGTDLSRVALINSVATADGVSAGPVLGIGFGGAGAGPVPVLLVGDELPASVRDYLAATPEVDADGNKTNLLLVSIGGTAVVSDAVMEAAVDAAGSADALSVKITAAVSDPGTINLVFSDAVDNDDEKKSLLKDALFVNGSPASLAGGVAGIANASDKSCLADPKQTVTLTHALQAGDRIEVRPTAATVIGDNDDRRQLGSASFTVPADKALSTAKPSTEIVAVAGTNSVIVYSDKEGTGDPKKVKVRRGSVTKEATGNPVASAAAGPFGFRYSFTIPVIATDDGNPANGDETKLLPNDMVTLGSGAITATKSPTQDETDSRQDSRRVTAAKRLSVSAIHVSPVDPIVNDASKASAVRMSNERIVSRRASVVVPGSPGDNSVTVTGLWSGDAAGAAGNGWSVSVDAVTGIKKDAKNVEIDVSVNARNRVIRVRYLAGTPTVKDLLDALNGHEGFAAHFSASAESCESDNLKAPVTTSAAEDELSKGVSSVGVIVAFNDWVQALATDGKTLKGDVFGKLITGYPADAEDGSVIAEATGLDESAFEDGADLVYAVSDARPATATLPYNRVHFLVSTRDAAKLPTTRSGSNVVTISSGDRPSGTAFVEDDYVATGYFAQDTDTTNADETRNAARRVPARRVNSVPVR